MELKEWLAVLEDEPDNELVRFTVAKSYMDLKQWDAAKLHFERLVADNPQYALAWAFLARSLLNLGLKDECRLVCEKAMPVVKAQRHEIPLEEIESVLAELDSEF